MISVTRLDGTRVIVNAELIETVEAVPETVIVLVTRRRIMVREPVDEVIDRVLAYRRGLGPLALTDVARGVVPPLDTEPRGGS
ncbi:MAG: flagellar FlbD family protein [Thermomicrobium sp.]|nr:flagellar FlbD family protein [Thermomicrobium sp.]